MRQRFSRPSPVTGYEKVRHILATTKNNKEARSEIKPIFTNRFSAKSSSSIMLFVGPHKTDRLKPINPKQPNPIISAIKPIQFRLFIIFESFISFRRLYIFISCS